MYDIDERRKFPRIKVSFRVFCFKIESENIPIKFDRERLEAATLDLSEGGVSLVVGNYLPENTKLLLKFVRYQSDYSESANSDELVTVSGEVAYALPYKNGRYRLGISFGKVDEEKESKFFDLICLPYN